MSSPINTSGMLHIAKQIKGRLDAGRRINGQRRAQKMVIAGTDIYVDDQLLSQKIQGQDKGAGAGAGENSLPDNGLSHSCRYNSLATCD